MEWFVFVLFLVKEIRSSVYYFLKTLLEYLSRKDRVGRYSCL